MADISAGKTDNRLRSSTGDDYYLQLSIQCISTSVVPLQPAQKHHCQSKKNRIDFRIVVSIEYKKSVLFECSSFHTVKACRSKKIFERSSSYHQNLKNHVLDINPTSHIRGIHCKSSTRMVGLGIVMHTIFVITKTWFSLGTLQASHTWMMYFEGEAGRNWTRLRLKRHGRLLQQSTDSESVDLTIRVGRMLQQPTMAVHSD
jgi:hypothetical protein